MDISGQMVDYFKVYNFKIWWVGAYKGIHIHTGMNMVHCLIRKWLHKRVLNDLICFPLFFLYRWSNPVFAGAFAAGLIHTLLCFLIMIIPDILYIITAFISNNVVFVIKCPLSKRWLFCSPKIKFFPVRHDTHLKSWPLSLHYPIPITTPSLSLTLTLTPTPTLTLTLTLNLTQVLSDKWTFFEFWQENGKIALRFKETSDYREVPVRTVWNLKQKPEQAAMIHSAIC